MSDLIERDKAIDAIRNHIKDIDGDNDALDYIATNMLKDVPSADRPQDRATDRKRRVMTEVYCTFDKCLFYKPYDEDYGVCTKDHITLDEEVLGIICGCPDAEWDEPQTMYYPQVDGITPSVIEPKTEPQT